MAFSSCFDVLVDVFVVVHLGNPLGQIIKLDHRNRKYHFYMQKACWTGLQSAALLGNQQIPL